MNLDDQQRLDLSDACARLAHYSTRISIAQSGGKLTLGDFGRWLAEIRNAEQVLVSTYQEWEETARDVAERENDDAKPPERDLSEVLGRMLGVIPEHESGLRARLIHIREALPFRAPEVEVLSWREVQALLKSYVPDLVEPWHHEAAAIFSGRA